MGDRENHIVRLQNAQVTVDGFGRVEEERRGASARQLPQPAADDAGLAHAGDDDAPAALEQQAHGLFEPFVQAFDQRQDGVGLGLQDFPGEREIDRGEPGHPLNPEPAEPGLRTPDTGTAIADSRAIA